MPNQATHCYMIPGATSIIDVINPRTGLGHCVDSTLAQCRDEYGPDVVIMDLDSAIEAVQQAQREEFCTGPVEITAEAFEEALNVLPPVCWVGYQDGYEQNTESFKISEMLCGNLTSIYCRIGARYFTLTEKISTPHPDVVAACRAFITANG